MCFLLIDALSTFEVDRIYILKISKLSCSLVLDLIFSELLAHVSVFLTSPETPPDGMDPFQINSEAFPAEVCHPWARWEGPGWGVETSSGGRRLEIYQFAPLGLKSKKYGSRTE